MESKSTKQRGSHVGQLNNDLPYKHKVIPAPSIKEMKKRKETTITRFFVQKTNHRHQQVYESRTKEQNTINNIVSLKQGITRKKITDTTNKQNKLISSPKILTTQKNNLQYSDISAANNKYCAPINTNHLHSIIHQTRQLIFFSVMVTKKS